MTRRRTLTALAAAALALIAPATALATTVQLGPSPNCSVTAYTPTEQAGQIDWHAGVSCGAADYNAQKTLNACLQIQGSDHATWFNVSGQCPNTSGTANPIGAGGGSAYTGTHLWRVTATATASKNGNSDGGEAISATFASS